MGTKLLLGAGDHAINVALAALSFFYLRYLTVFAGLEPVLAGAVPLVGRFVDAITDPLMGRLSDATRLRAGRRRPYFLIGALPLGLSFALLWSDPPLTSQAAKFAYYSGVYIFFALASTVIAVPYTAILPELVSDFDERTSVNGYRSVLALLGILLAATCVQPLAQAFGGGSTGYLLGGCVLGAWMSWPWFALYAVVRERGGGGAAVAQPSGREALRALRTHPTYLRLVGMYVCGRIAMDLVAALLIFYFADWLGRPGDFEPVMGLFLLSAAAALPFWVWLAKRTDKRRVFLFGCSWWGAAMVLFLAIHPDFPPRWVVFAFAACTAVGYGVVDMMPWSMLADVIDEDELRSGARREGIYAGTFTFVRKLGGASGVFLAGLILQLSGYTEGATQQPDTARQAVRWLSALGPALALAAAVWIARGYPLSRIRHAALRSQIAALRASREVDARRRDP